MVTKAVSKILLPESFIPVSEEHWPVGSQCGFKSCCDFDDKPGTASEKEHQALDFTFMNFIKVFTSNTTIGHAFCWLLNKFGYEKWPLDNFYNIHNLTKWMYYPVD